MRAAADGKIVRLRIEWRGYGNAIYIEHSGGDVTLYGHLDRFSDELGLPALVEAARSRKNDRYPGDIFPPVPISVRAGQVIAFSGESGAGLPHLHFEIRRNGVEPIDPLDAGFPAGRDDPAPALHEIEVIPLSLDSRVEGRPGSERLALRQIAPSTYDLMKPIRVAGPFRLALIADCPSPPDHHAGLGGWELSVDDRPVASLRISRMTFQSYFLSPNIYDPDGSSADLGIFKMWLSPPPPGLFGPSNGSGELNLPIGKHRIAIRGFDAAGRSSIATLDVEVKRLAPPRAAGGTNHDASNRPAFGDVERRLEGLVVGAPLVEEDFPAEGSIQQAAVESNGVTSPVPFVDSAGIRFVFIPDKDTGEGRFSVKLGPRRIEIASSRKQSRVELETTAPPRSFTAILPGEPGLFATRVDPGSIVPKPPAPAIQKLPGAFTRRSDLIRIGPGWSADILGAALRARGASIRDSFYRYDLVERRWVPAGSVKRSSPGETIDLRLRRPGIFAVFEDTRPPVLDRIGRFSDERGSGIAIDCYDLESGVDKDGAVIRLRSGGPPLVAEVDPDRGIATWRTIPAGNFVVEAIDRAGNLSSLEVLSGSSLPVRKKNPAD